MAQISDAMHKAGTQAERTAIANDLLGRSGVELIPMLQKGSEHLLEMSNRAEELGQVLSKDTVQALADAQQAIDDFKNSATIAFGQAIHGARDLLKTLKGEGLNEKHQLDIDLNSQAEQEAKELYNRVFKAQHGRDATALDRMRDRSGIRETKEKILNRLYRERLEAQKEIDATQAEASAEEQAAAKRQAAWDEAKARAAELDKREAEARAKAEEKAANAKKLQEMYADGVRKRELARAPIIQQIRANEDQIERLRAVSEDHSAEQKERERAVREILRLEEQNLRLKEQQLEAQRAPTDLPEEEEEEETPDEVKKLWDTAKADPTGKTVAGREAIAELKKMGELSKNQMEAYHQLTEPLNPLPEQNPFTEATKAGLEEGATADRNQFETQLFKNLHNIERALKGKFTNQ